LITLKLIEDIDTTIDTIFHTAKVQIENTKTNRELNKIEDQYLPKFNKIFTRIVTEYSNYQYLLNEAEKRYGIEVHNLIKSLTTQTYLLGMDYVARAVNKPELIYLTQSDVTNIIMQSDEAYRMFWRLINKYLQVVKNRGFKKIAAITNEITNSSDESDNTLLDTLTNAKLIINAILTPILAYSTIQKFREISQTEQQQLILSQNPNIKKQDLLSENTTVVFATERDVRVCPICIQYDGQEWKANSSYIVIPRVNTHPRCRCRLLLRINGRTISK
jgi:hypothetical protein